MLLCCLKIVSTFIIIFILLLQQTGLKAVTTNTDHNRANSQSGCSQDRGWPAYGADMHVGSSYTATLIAQAAGGVSQTTDAAVPLEAI